MQLGPIENSEHHMNSLKRIEKLMEKEILSEDEKELLIELATFVEEYENEHFPMKRG